MFRIQDSAPLWFIFKSYTKTSNASSSLHFFPLLLTVSSSLSFIHIYDKIWTAFFTFSCWPPLRG